MPIKQCRPCHARPAQRGAVLIITLLFLVLLTMIAVTAMTTSTLQERMAGNFRDLFVAQAGADSALQEVEDRIVTLTVDDARNGACGTYAANGVWDLTCLANIDNASVWTTSYWLANGVPLNMVNGEAHDSGRYVLALYQELKPPMLGPSEPAKPDSVFHLGVGYSGGSSSFSDRLLSIMYVRRYD